MPGADGPPVSLCTTSREMCASRATFLFLFLPLFPPYSLQNTLKTQHIFGLIVYTLYICTLCTTQLCRSGATCLHIHMHARLHARGLSHFTDSQKTPALIERHQVVPKGS